MSDQVWSDDDEREEGWQKGRSKKRKKKSKRNGAPEWDDKAARKRRRTEVKAKKKEEAKAMARELHDETARGQWWAPVMKQASEAAIQTPTATPTDPHTPWRRSTVRRPFDHQPPLPLTLTHRGEAAP